jgi:hypothetical protein
MPLMMGTERVGGVAALKTDLVRPLLAEVHEEIRVEREAAVDVRVGLGDPALNGVGSELLVPARVQRVADEVHPPPVAADLDHLRRAVEGLPGLGVRRLANYAAEVERAGVLRLEVSETSYWRISPVPQHETYRKRSSRERFMSVTSGGTAPKSLSIGDRRPGSASSSGMSMTFLMSHLLLLAWRCHSQTEAERSLVLTTTQAKP